ncbi:MAG: questin oxidase family protein [Aquabacterium sp.]|nr:questin oxidase family protein [Aquabacterium sp.]
MSTPARRGRAQRAAAPVQHPGVNLHALLDAAGRFGPEYGEGLASHLPMGLVALRALGADSQRMQAFAWTESAHLLPAPPPQAWTAGDPWPDRLGDIAAWPAYVDLFGQWLAAEGAADVLAQVLPQLMPGCAAAAFHGPIRTAAALRAGHAGELAAGLAYWAVRHQRLGALPAQAGTVADPLVLLRRLQAVPSTRPLIAQGMADAASHPALRAAVPRLAIGPDTLAQLSRLAAQAYAGSGNFTALHMVTASHAMRLLLPFVEAGPAADAALRWFWQAWATALVAACLQPLPPLPLLPWPTIVQRALASADAHVIKLVDACRAEEAAHGGSSWQQAASRAVTPG